MATPPVNTPVLDLGEAASILSTRSVARKIRSEILEYISQNQRPVLDLRNVELMTSAFADELFGILVEEIGLPEFEQIQVLYPEESRNRVLLKLLVQKVIATRINRSK